MKLSEFVGLSEDQKRALLLIHGVPIARRQLSDNLVFLYDFAGLMVETVCRDQHSEIHEYRILLHTEQLMPYLESIEVDDLLD